MAAFTTYTPATAPSGFAAILDEAHKALREVDASDTTAPQTTRALDAVSAAVARLETFARSNGIVLSEFADLRRA